MNNKKGFTLVELLAVIVILGIILIIATMSVNKVIKSSRTKAFDETALVATKAAKKALLSEEGTFAEAFKEEMDYDADEYDFEINSVSDGYQVILYATSDGKFKNIDFRELTKLNSKFRYGEYEKGGNIYKAISFIVKLEDGKIAKDTSDTVKTTTRASGTPNSSSGATSSTQNTSTSETTTTTKIITTTKKSCVEMEKKESYVVGDKVWFCNDDGTKEEFMVIAANTETVSLFAKYGLKETTKGPIQSKDSAKKITLQNFTQATTLATNYAKYIKEHIFNNTVNVTGRIIESEEVFAGKTPASYSYYLFSQFQGYESWYLISEGHDYWACNGSSYNGSKYVFYAVTYKTYTIKDENGKYVNTDSLWKYEFNGYNNYNPAYEVRPVITIPTSAIKK